MDFSQISLFLVVASIFGIIATKFRQPLIVGYILGGIFLTSFGLVEDTESFSGLGQIGVALLLFLLGLEMNLKEIPTIGKVALSAGLIQIALTSLIGFFLSSVLGLGLLPSIYIAISLTFSSTIIMVKLLSEKKDLASLYGRLSIGILLVQDFIAILILMFLAGLRSGGNTPVDLLAVIPKGLALFLITYLLSKKLFPLIFEHLLSASIELLFIGSIAWALGFAGFVQGTLGFSFEIGGFLAGLALSGLPEHLQIAGRTRPLRDFFLTIFFLLLGTRLVGGVEFLSLLPKGLILSLFVLIGNPLIVMGILGFLGYKSRTSFLVGSSFAQISEFSLILISMGLSLGHVGTDHVSLVTMVGAVTMTASTYVILRADKIYKKLKNYLKIFERSVTREEINISAPGLSNHTVLVGCDRTGSKLLPFFQKNKLPFVIVDFNPNVFTRLFTQKLPVIFGDISDDDILKAASIDSSSVVLSTISNLTDNLTLLEHLSGAKRKPLTLFTSATREEAISLYEKGATLVVVPDIVAGDYLKHLFKTYKFKKEKLIKIGQIHFNRLMYK